MPDDLSDPKDLGSIFEEVWANHNPVTGDSTATCPNDGYRMTAQVFMTEQERADITINCPRCGFQRFGCERDPRIPSFRTWTDDEKQEMVDTVFQGRGVACPVDGTRLRSSPSGTIVCIQCYRCGNMHIGNIHSRIGSVTNPPIPVRTISNLGRPSLTPIDFLPEVQIAMEWDLFISHAHEDKESIAEPLAIKLKELGLRIWYDKFTLRMGDSLRRSIDDGLARSKYGLVILSPHFFKKEWPQKELDGLAALESGKNKKILPVWHNVSQKDVAGFSPTLADRIGVPTTHGMDYVIEQVMAVFRPDFDAVPKPGTPATVLTEQAIAVLKQAASGPLGRLLSLDDSSDGYSLQAGEFSYEENDGGSRRQSLRYKAVIRQLFEGGFISEITEGLYELTESGYQIAEGAA